MNMKELAYRFIIAYVLVYIFSIVLGNWEWYKYLLGFKEAVEQFEWLSYFWKSFRLTIGIFLLLFVYDSIVNLFKVLKRKRKG